jgi:hypothetical protein
MATGRKGGKLKAGMLRRERRAHALKNGAAQNQRSSFGLPVCFSEVISNQPGRVISNHLISGLALALPPPIPDYSSKTDYGSLAPAGNPEGGG